MTTTSFVNFSQVGLRHVVLTVLIRFLTSETGIFFFRNWIKYYQNLLCSFSKWVNPPHFNQFSENWSGSSHGFAWFLHILYLDMLEDQFQIFFKKFPELFFLWIFSQRTPWIFWKTSSINTNIRIFFISFIIKENYLELILSKSTPNIL